MQSNAAKFSQKNKALSPKNNDNQQDMLKEGSLHYEQIEQQMHKFMRDDLYNDDDAESNDDPKSL